MQPAQPTAVPPPHEGLWRVARGSEPLRPPSSPRGRLSGGANRFDPLTHDVGVLYFGTDLETCFGETLARFRPSLKMLSVVAEEWRELGFMDAGTVAADWRQRSDPVPLGRDDLRHLRSLEIAQGVVGGGGWRFPEVAPRHGCTRSRPFRHRCAPCAAATTDALGLSSTSGTAATRRLSD